MFNNKVIFVTGGTGSFGQKFIQTILKNFNPKKIIVFSRDELKQFELQRIYPGKDYPTVRFFLGDIRDRSLLDNIISNNNINLIIHLAAMAGVGPSIIHPELYYDVNINGTVNVLELALKQARSQNRKIKFFC